MQMEISEKKLSISMKLRNIAQFVLMPGYSIPNTFSLMNCHRIWFKRQIMCKAVN